MLFSSTSFLFAFLPIFLGLYFLLPGTRLRNMLLLLGSLFFYAWGEAFYVLVLLASIVLNYAFGLLIEARKDRRAAFGILSAAVSMNLLLLGVFKYADFGVENLNLILSQLGLGPIMLPSIHLPIGISFFSFQAITYVVDIYRRQAQAQKNPLRVGLYISLFPQLIAGPIVRYRQIADQLRTRQSRLKDIAEGMRRFVVGLAKKVLIANTLGQAADSIFSIPAAELQPAVAWLGILSFTFQIYFDFAGYSDMAIGLGRCFGFSFPENFNWPYRSHSMREFWRRWHISLSTFFRDYLYIPLGGNRRGHVRTSLNLILVFLLCGLWHGASWNFVIWGMIHGLFLALERSSFGSLLSAWPRTIQSLYVLIVVLLSWVFFRADDLTHAWAYLNSLLGLNGASGNDYPLSLYLNPRLILILCLASLSLSSWPRSLWLRFSNPAKGRELPFESLRLAALFLIFLLSAMSLAMGTHNPFIYFRF
jgi:alginate O-acetyltransferase complex protein AlgI